MEIARVYESGLLRVRAQGLPDTVLPLRGGMPVSSLERFGAGHEVEQLGRSLVLASLTCILAQLFQFLEDIFMGGIHSSETSRVLAGERLDGGLG